MWQDKTLCHYQLKKHSHSQILPFTTPYMATYNIHIAQIQENQVTLIITHTFIECQCQLLFLHILITTSNCAFHDPKWFIIILYILSRSNTNWNLSNFNLCYSYPSKLSQVTSTWLAEIPIGIKYQLDSTYTTTKEIHKWKEKVK